MSEQQVFASLVTIFSLPMMALLVVIAGAVVVILAADYQKLR